MFYITKEKMKLGLEIFACGLAAICIPVFVGWIEALLNTEALWTGIAAYLISVFLILFYVVKIEKKSLTNIGLKKPCLADIPKGLLLGFFMFILQQIPLLILRMDYSSFAAQPDPAYMLVMTAYCFLCVGFAEELIFRGFLLHKTLELCGSKIAAVGLNILLFYGVHWSAMQFTFGELYNLSVNTLVFCVFLFKSRGKSIIPLIIAHGFYDVLTSVLLPVFIYSYVL